MLRSLYISSARASAKRSGALNVKCGLARESTVTKSLAGPSSLQSRAYSLKFARAASASAAAALKRVKAKPQPLHDTAPNDTEFPESTPWEAPSINVDERRVNVSWDPVTWSKYHNVWLRDHCRCPQCFHQITKQRLVDTFSIPPDIKPSKVEATSEGLQVTWPSSKPHISVYPWEWLKLNSYDPILPNERKKLLKPDQVLWGAKIDQDPPTLEYEWIMNDDRGLLRWLQRIDAFGFCFITGVPPTPEATEQLARRISYIRETQYGTFWDFTSDLAKGDTAYTNMALPAHTDTTYYTDPCGLQLFHLLEHTNGTGGATLLVDGFYVASILKELHPDVYKLLSTVRVPAHAAGEPDSLYRPSPDGGYPLLNHNPVSGELVQVRYNNDDRSVMRNMDPGSVEQWYNALRTWHKFLTSHDSEYWVQLSPGTAVVVDNHRVLHGRSAFDGKRRMCGAYIGRDEYRSTLTALLEKYTNPEFANDTVVIGKQIPRNIWSPDF